MKDSSLPSVSASERPSVVASFLFLIWLSWQRQARARQMVWIALILLAFTATVVVLHTAGQGWGMHHWRWPRGSGPSYEAILHDLQVVRQGLPWPSGAAAVQDGFLGATEEVLKRSGFFVFSNSVVFTVFLSFLMPLFSLSFATEALAGERESRSLVWLLTRPLSRSGIYLAKFAALAPWAMGLNLGGFALLCLTAGRPGAIAFSLYWPAVLWGTLAFCALFHLLGGCFRRAAVIGIVYAFFLETILGNMPGTMKRVSISFYVRCLMFEEARDFGFQPQNPAIYLPVDGVTARWVLAGITLGLLAAGMFFFARMEYQE